MTQDVTWAWLPAAPHPFQPPHHRDPAQTGRIVQHPGAAAVAGRNHPARRAAGFDLIRLHRYDQPAVTIIFNIEHVPAGNIKDHIGSGAPAQATHRMGHRRVLRGTGAWSPLILKVPTPLLGHQHAQPDTRHTTVNSEDPVNSIVISTGGLFHVLILPDSLHGKYFCVIWMYSLITTPATRYLRIRILYGCK